MKHKINTRIMSRGVILALALALLAGFSFGQNLVVSGSGSFAGSGVINVKGNINTSGASGAVNIPGTVNLNGDALQQLGVSGQNALTFSTLQALGTSIKQMDVNVSADALIVNNANNFNVQGNSLVVTAATVTNGVINVGSGGSSVFNGALSIAATGEVRATNGALDFNADVNNSGTITLEGSGTANFGGAFTSVGTLSFASGSTVEFDGGSQTIPAVTYGNLILSGSGAKTGAAGSIALAGNLTLNQNLDVYTNSGTLVFSAPGSVSGSAEVIGAVQRTHTFAAGTPYAFNRQEVVMQFAALENEDVTIVMRPGVAPSGVGANYINRYYGVTSNANLSVNNASMQLYYVDGEIVGTIDENRLGLNKYDGSALSKLGSNGGSYSRNVSGPNNTIALSAINQGLAGITEFAMTPIEFYTIANGNWNAIATWGSTSDDIPTATDDAEVRHTVDVTADASIANLTVEDVTYNGVLNVSGANFSAASIINTGAINVSSGRTLTVTGALSINSGGASSMLVNGIASLNSVANNGSFIVDGASAQANLTGAFDNNAGATLTTQNGGSLRVTGANLTNAGAITNNGSITVE